MKKAIIIVISFCFFFSEGILAQSISGIVNDYTAVQSIDVACPNSITVNDASAFGIGDFTLLIQMNGATIVTANNSTYGNISNYNAAGSYETLTVLDIVGNDIYFDADLLNSYNVSNAVQLVRVPIYNGATITGPIRSAFWDGSIGGIVAIIDTGTLTMQSNIAISGRGFRGGVPTEIGSSSCSPFFGSSANYEYPAGSLSGKDKGEGIGGTYGLHGRGKAANGGGGGNDHKAGGGGGALYTNGGQGSRHDDANGFGISCNGVNPGLGGVNVSNAITSKLFLGGGGGAGANANGGNYPSGGAAGGLIIVEAQNLTSNNRSIFNNGFVGTTGASNGAGGGGAGGTTIVSTSSLTGNLNIYVNGGNGGNSNSSNTTNGALRSRCWGKGGGGSGGVVHTSFAASANYYREFNGGTPGVEINGNSTCLGSSSNAAAGATGVEYDNTTFSLFDKSNPVKLDDSIIVAAQPLDQSVCLGSNAMFTFNTSALSGNNNEWRWQIDSGAGWQFLSNNATYNNVTSNTLTVNSVNGTMQGDLFRCLVITECRDAKDTSLTAQLVINAGPTFDATNDILSQQLDSASCVINDASWHYFYNDSGELLLGINSNGQNLGTVQAKIEINNNGPFGSDLNCVSGTGGELHLGRIWTIDVQNQPATSCDVRFFFDNTELSDFATLTQAQSSNYNQCWGMVFSEANLMMTVIHGMGKETLIPTYSAGLTTGRMASFSLDSFSTGYLHSNGGLETNALPVTYLSIEGKRVDNANVIEWTTATEINNSGFGLERATNGYEFEQISFVEGNGNSNELNAYVFHDLEIDLSQTYYYRLKQIDYNGAFDYSAIVSVEPKDAHSQFELYPNPATSFLTLKGKFDLKGGSIQAYDVSGRLISSQVINAENTTHNIDLTDFDNGTYFFRIQDGQKIYTERVVVIR